MRVLDADEKKIYESINIIFEPIDCWNTKTPKSWKKIKVAKFE